MTNPECPASSQLLQQQRHTATAIECNPVLSQSFAHLTNDVCFSASNSPIPVDIDVDCRRDDYLYYFTPLPTGTPLPSGTAVLTPTASVYPTPPNSHPPTPKPTSSCSTPLNTSNCDVQQINLTEDSFCTMFHNVNGVTTSCSPSLLDEAALVDVDTSGARDRDSSKGRSNSPPEVPQMRRCTTIVYQRHVNCNLEERRTYYCNYPGKCAIL